MDKETCDACGRAVEAKSATKHRIVPDEVAKLHGILDSAKHIPIAVAQFLGEITVRNI